LEHDSESKDSDDGDGMGEDDEDEDAIVRRLFNFLDQYNVLQPSSSSSVQTSAAAGRKRVAA
jgi:hypothetical protein